MRPEEDQKDRIAILGAAAELLQAGRPAEAEKCYRQLLEGPSLDLEALNGLAVALLSQGQIDAALAAARRLIAAAPQVPVFQGTLGQALAAAGSLAEAIPALTFAVDHEPGLFPLLGMLAHCLDQTGQSEKAIAVLDRLIAADPDDLAAHNDRAALLQQLNRMAEAESAYRAILVRPGAHPETAYNLGNLLNTQNRPRDAVAMFDQALVARPNWAAAWHNRAVALNNLGAFLSAGESYRRAIAAEPGFIEPLTGLAAVLRDMGDTPKAMELMDRAIAMAPKRADIMGRALFTANYHPDWDGVRLSEEYRRFDMRFVRPLAASAKPVAPQALVGRRLRLAYFSPDFRNTSMAPMIAPLLQNHDRSRFELHAYHLSPLEDDVTKRLANGFDHFHRVARLADADLASRIRQDGIDILIDLAGHANGGRPLALAQRPAPLMLSFYGLGTTTGISTLDGFVSDIVMAPLGSESCFIEPVRRLARTALCWQPPAQLPVPIDSMPTATGPVFCSMSRTARLNTKVLKVWGRILQAVPNARLRLDQLPFADAPTADAIRAVAAQCGIPVDRLDLTYRSPAYHGYSQADIALDPFPHNGGVTTLEALWMGLPVVTLAARPPLGRISATLLTAIGRTDLIAANEDQYVAIAVELAKNLPAVRQGRMALHQALAQSDVCDGQGFTQAIEALCLTLWTEKFP